MSNLSFFKGREMSRAGSPMVGGIADISRFELYFDTGIAYSDEYLCSWWRRPSQL